MLNRKYQVLLNDWMVDYIKFTAERYDMKISAEIRIYMCLGIFYVISILYPEHKINLIDEEFLELSKKASKKELREEEVLQMVSKVLFETRKAVEYRLSKERKLKRNSLFMLSISIVFDRGAYLKLDQPVGGYGYEKN